MPWPCSVPTGALASVAPGAARDPFETSIDQLMDVEVTRLHFRAERRPLRRDRHHADDIRDHGYRTLAEALCSVRGVYVNYDRIYDYFGVRQARGRQEGLPVLVEALAQAALSKLRKPRESPVPPHAVIDNISDAASHLVAHQQIVGDGFKFQHLLCDTLGLASRRG